MACKTAERLASGIRPVTRAGSAPTIRRMRRALPSGLARLISGAAVIGAMVALMYLTVTVTAEGSADGRPAWRRSTSGC